MVSLISILNRGAAEAQYGGATSAVIAIADTGAQIPLQAAFGDMLRTDLPAGAHLVTLRKGYVHHGIYAGGGRVVHYAGLSRSLRRGPVEEVSLARFANGRGYQLKHHAAAKFTGREVVARARSRLGENSYSLLNNNCEHFCEWCICGTNRSTQVEAWLPTAAVIGSRSRTARGSTSGFIRSLATLAISWSRRSVRAGQPSYSTVRQRA